MGAREGGRGGDQFAFNSSVLDQGLPKGGHYDRSTTVLIPWSLRVDTRSKGGVGCVYVCGLGWGGLMCHVWLLYVVRDRGT